MRECSLFIARVPREEEDCCLKVLIVVLCTAPAQKMKEGKHILNTLV